MSACQVLLFSVRSCSALPPPPPFFSNSTLSFVCGSVLQQVYTVELFFVSHPGLGGKYREECCRGDERRRRGATETEGGVHSSGILLGWSVFATPLVSTTDVNRRLDPEFQQRQSFPLTSSRLCSQLELNPPSPPQWKRCGGQHLKTLINGYFCIRRERKRLYFV